MPPLQTATHSWPACWGTEQTRPSVSFYNLWYPDGNLSRERAPFSKAWDVFASKGCFNLLAGEKERDTGRKIHGLELTWIQQNGMWVGKREGGKRYPLQREPQFVCISAYITSLCVSPSDSVSFGQDARFAGEIFLYVIICVWESKVAYLSACFFWFLECSWTVLSNVLCLTHSFMEPSP